MFTASVFAPCSTGFTEYNAGVSVSGVEHANMTEKSFFDFFCEVENFLKNPKEECSKRVLENEELESIILAFGAKLEQMLKKGDFENHYGKDVYERAVKVWGKLCEIEKHIGNKRDSEDGIFGNFVRKISDYWCEILKKSTDDVFFGRTFKKINFYDKWKFEFFSFVSVCLSKEVIQKINYNEIKVNDKYLQGTTYNPKMGTYVKPDEGISATGSGQNE